MAGGRAVESRLVEMHWKSGEKPTVVFRWVEGQRFVFRLTAKEVAERFGPGDNLAAWKVAQENFFASEAAKPSAKDDRYIKLFVAD